MGVVGVKRLDDDATEILQKARKLRGELWETADELLAAFEETDSLTIFSELELTINMLCNGVLASKVLATSCRLAESSAEAGNQEQ